MKQTACPELSRIFLLLACHSARSTVGGRPALELGGAGLGCRRGALAAALVVSPGRPGRRLAGMPGGRCRGQLLPVLEDLVELLARHGLVGERRWTTMSSLSRFCERTSCA